MRLLEKLTEEQLREKSREELESLVIEELKSKKDSELIHLILSTRRERVRCQRAEINLRDKEVIEHQIKLIDLLQSEDVDETKKDKAYYSVLKYLKQESPIFNKDMVLALEKMIKYAIIKEEAEEIDYLLKKSVKLFNDIIWTENGRPAGIFVRYPYVDKLLEIDAKLDLDDMAMQHINSATTTEYGDLIRKGENGYFYYSKEYYIERYKKQKEQFKTEGFTK